jgi:hypothetical protein
MGRRVLLKTDLDTLPARCAKILWPTRCAELVKKHKHQ